MSKSNSNERLWLILKRSRCEHCEKKITWKAIMSTGLFSNSYKCDSCGTLHKLTFVSKVIDKLSIIIPILIVIWFPNEIRALTNVFFSFFILFLWYFTSIVILPFYLKYELVGNDHGLVE